MAARNTYKRELIKAINKSFKLSNIDAPPRECLEDMGTIALVKFQSWVDPFLLSVRLTAVSHRLPPKKT